MQQKMPHPEPERLNRQRGGMFITFEGPDAAGKSTQARMLADVLHEAGYTVHLTREPGGTRLGEALRDLVKGLKTEDPLVPEAELLLFGASRAQLVRRVIEPRLKKGEIVICDRFSDSTTVYQGIVQNIDLSFIRQMHDFTNQSTEPDLTILLDVTVATSFERCEGRNIEQKTQADRFEAESSRFHENVRQGFLQLARQEPGRINIVDGDASPESIHAHIKELVSKHGLESIQ